MRSNITLKQSHGDMKRLMKLLANNDVPRISILLKACLQQNYGVKSTIDKLEKVCRLCIAFM